MNNSIYEELVASSSQLYGAEKAVETERQMLGMRLKDMQERYGRKTIQKETQRSKIATLLGLLSGGYKEIMAIRDLDKKGQELIEKNFVPKENWEKMSREEKWSTWYDYYSGQTRTPGPVYTPPVTSGLYTSPDYKYDLSKGY